MYNSFGKDFDPLPSWLFKEPYDRSAIDGDYKVVKNGSKNRWTIQRNICTEDVFRVYTVQWSTEYVEDEEFTNDGAGRGTNFIASLRKEDQIAVWARAKVSVILPNTRQEQTHRLYRLLTPVHSLQRTMCNTSKLKSTFHYLARLFESRNNSRT